MSKNLLILFKNILKVYFLDISTIQNIRIFSGESAIGGWISHPSSLIVYWAAFVTKIQLILAAIQPVNIFALFHFPLQYLMGKRKITHCRML